MEESEFFGYHVLEHFFGLINFNFLCNHLLPSFLGAAAAAAARGGAFSGGARELLDDDGGGALLPPTEAAGTRSCIAPITDSIHASCSVEIKPVTANDVQVRRQERSQCILEIS